MNAEEGTWLSEAIHATGESHQASTLARSRSGLAISIPSLPNGCIETRLADELSQLKTSLKVATNGVEIDRSALDTVAGQ